jgi:hypothetical protein
MRTKVKTPPIRPSTADADVIERRDSLAESADARQFDSPIAGAPHGAEMLPSPPGRFLARDST